MRSPWLLLASFAAPLLFISPAAAQTGPPCCQPPEGEAHPPDPNRGPIFVPAEVRRPDELALEASAEAPIPVEVPLADAIAFPREERAEAIEPLREPERARIVEPPPLQVDADVPPMPDEPISLPPCCQVEGETHPPDRRPENTPPVLVGAEVRRRDERALEAAAEVPIPAQAPRVDAIGIPLEERPGVSEPAHVPVRQLIIALFLILVAIGFWLFRPRRRPRLEPKRLAVPVYRPPLPEALLRLLEPVSAPAVKAAPELEPV